MMHGSQFRSGQISFLGLKIAVNENYDIHYSVYTEHLLQMWRPIILFNVWCLDIPFFHHFCTAQGVKQNNLVPLVVL